MTIGKRKLVGALRGRAGVVAIAGVAGVAGVGTLAVSERTAESARRAEEVIESLDAGAVRREALAAGEWDLPNLDHERVDFWVERFTTDGDMEKKFRGFLARAGRYEEMIRESLRRRGMPEDLLYLAMIESGFQPHAYSPAAASGLWQFIAETGKRYGLRVDGEVDERNDPEEATRAALDYLEELHERFGSWYLAAAAYNTGENRVGRIMREETGSEKGTDADYYRIWDRLPRETRDYVPLMIAAARISKDRDRYGFGDVEPESPLQYDVVVTDAGFTLQTVSEVSGADVGELKLLNPHLRNGRLPGNERFALRLPAGTGKAFEENWPKAVAERKAGSIVAESTRSYKVRRGDNLTRIARRHGMSVRELRRTNGLRNDRIYAGQVLRIEAR